jgi:hypothetical protein
MLLSRAINYVKLQPGWNSCNNLLCFLISISNKGMKWVGIKGNLGRYIKIKVLRIIVR